MKKDDFVLQQLSMLNEQYLVELEQTARAYSQAYKEAKR
jgi:hypothetical protein